MRAAKSSDFQSNSAIINWTIHLYTFKNKILWCFDFILALKSASKLWYEKLPPSLARWKEVTWILSFPYIYLPMSCLVVCSICTAQLSSGCPDLSGMDEDEGNAERFTQYRLPTPSCRAPCLHSEADTAIARGTQTHFCALDQKSNDFICRSSKNRRDP